MWQNATAEVTITSAFSFPEWPAATLRQLPLTGVPALTEISTVPGTGDSVQCHCCNMLYAAGDVVHFYSRPADALCRVCAEWLHTTAALSPAGIPSSGSCPAMAAPLELPAAGASGIAVL